MFINRDYSRTEKDDFKLNVEDIIKDNNREAVPVYHEGKLVGWKLQTKYE